MPRLSTSCLPACLPARPPVDRLAYPPACIPWADRLCPIAPWTNVLPFLGAYLSALIAVA